MALWLVRAGNAGQHQEFCREHGLSVVGWDAVPDLAEIKSKEALKALMEQTYPGSPAGRISNYTGQVWAFRSVIQKGDLVALPLKRAGTILLGRVTGEYKHIPDNPYDARHTRTVEWAVEVPRTAFPQSVLYSFGAFMTVCQIQRDGAEELVAGLLAKKGEFVQPSEQDDARSTEVLDLEEEALQQLRQHIWMNFQGHKMSALIAAILEAQGYKVRVSPEGADGGVDVVAGYGPLGFDPPRLVAQVKMTTAAVDVKPIRELQGVMKRFVAQHGLFVSWAGYKGSTVKESAREYFELRLWDSEDIIREIQSVYHALPPSIQTDIPMKRIWTLVLGE